MEVSKDTALKIAMEAEHIIVLTAVIVAIADQMSMDIRTIMLQAGFQDTAVSTSGKVKTTGKY